MKTELKVINLFGGPGTGKSTTAAYIFHELKCAGKNVELVTEYAKDVVWEQRTNLFSDQVYICAKQNRRMERLVGQGVEIAVTDSPLILGAMYVPEGYYDNFVPLLVEIFKSYTNSLNVLLVRGFEYNPVGRYQTEAEAREIDRRISGLLIDHQFPFIIADVSRDDWKEKLMADIAKFTENN
jgi:nicotinamide riboside kinase